jgi:hypothetical protein
MIKNEKLYHSKIIETSFLPSKICGKPQKKLKVDLLP